MKLVDTIPKLVSLMLTLGKIQPIPLMLLYFSLKMFWPSNLNQIVRKVSFWCSQPSDIEYFKSEIENRYNIATILFTGKKMEE